MHQLDAARLFRLALETTPAGSVLHAVADDVGECVAWQAATRRVEYGVWSDHPHHPHAVDGWCQSRLCDEGRHKERSPSRLTGSIFMAICAGKYCNNCAGGEKPQRFRLPEATAVVDPRQTYEVAVSSQRQVRKCPAGDVCSDHAMA